MSTEAYKAWQNYPCIDQQRVDSDREKYGRKQLPSLLMLECYPTELMTEQEVTRFKGIMW